MRFLALAAVAVACFGCAYKAEPVAAPSYNVVTSFAKKVPGKWLLFTEGSALNQNVKPGGLSCAAHSFPVALEGTFATSVRETLDNVFESIEEIQQPIPGDQVRKRGARGLIVVRGEEVRPQLDVQPGFWTPNMRTRILVVASVYVDGSSGRIFGQTVEGQGTGDADGGMMCEGGAKSLDMSSTTAIRDVVRKLAEALGNADRVRAAK